jgi:hypothetical protein
MIGLCQAGKSSPGALQRSAGTKFFLVLDDIADGGLVEIVLPGKKCELDKIATA